MLCVNVEFHQFIRSFQSIFSTIHDQTHYASKDWLEATTDQSEDKRGCHICRHRLGNAPHDSVHAQTEKNEGKKLPRDPTKPPESGKRIVEG